MTGAIDLEIRDWLARYLNGDLSLHQFEDWFVPVAWNIEQTKNPKANELAGEVELRLAEFSNGHWTEAELRSRLEPLVSIYETELVPLAQQADTTYSFQSSLSISLASHAV
jgi:hypothetical protein